MLDVILIDVIRPAQWAAQGWAEPLDGYLGADKAEDRRASTSRPTPTPTRSAAS